MRAQKKLEAKKQQISETRFIFFKSRFMARLCMTRMQIKYIRRKKSATSVVNINYCHDHKEKLNVLLFSLRIYNDSTLGYSLLLKMNFLLNISDLQNVL
jgi:hypothetical protein